MEPTDLDRIAADLADVEHALARLDAGTYFTDEVTGAPLPAGLLEARPTAGASPIPSRDTDERPVIPAAGSTAAGSL